MKWLLRVVLLAVTGYLVLGAAVTAAMLQPPARFGQIMKYVPAPLAARPAHLDVGPAAARSLRATALRISRCRPPIAPASV